MQKESSIQWLFRVLILFRAIDLDLQEYGELLMQNKRGSIVAIEPKTGEVLTLISSPEL